MSEKKLFLLDAMALIYRAHFAFIRSPRIAKKTGMNTSAAFGFTLTLVDLLSKEQPSHLAVAFDTPAPTFRHEQFPEYKATRDEQPEDITYAIPLIKRLLKACNIPMIELDGFEADDVIGTLAKQAEAKGYKVYMVTPDKDYAQLVTSNVFLYKPSRQGGGIEILDPQKVEEKYGIPPAQVADFLGLKGDSVDNIPGIPKVGDKTAINLLQEYGSMEAIVEQAEGIKKKSIRESVIANKEQGILSKQLATIHTEAPIEWDEEHFKVGKGDPEATLTIMGELEFRTVVPRLLGTPIFEGQTIPQKDLFGNTISTTPVSSDAAAPLPGATDLKTLEDRDADYKVLETDADLDALIDKIKEIGHVCFDTETTSLNAMNAELIAMTFSLKVKEGFMLYFPEADPDLEKKLAKVKSVLESTEILKIGQNLKYDMLVLRKYDIKVSEPLFDTMLANYVIDPDRKHNMDAMAKLQLNYEPVSITSLIGKKGKGQLSMRSVPVEKLTAYACEDADITLELKEALEPQLDKGSVRSVFETIELPLVPVLTNMENIGIKIDEAALVAYSKELETQMHQIEHQIYGMAGVEFNINSPRQLGEVIFDKLKLAKGKKTKTGQYSTREEVLVELAAKHELPAYVLDFRKLGKLKSTYVDALPQLINERTGRIHTTFSQAVAATGRLSSNNPNLQNIPIRSERGREIRKAFIPEEGFTFMAADYSQVELRLMAHLSKDPSMLEDFRAGHDIHRATASRVFGVSMEDVDGDMRSKAKMVNFGIIYGISAFGLGQRLKISRTEAKDIIDSYFSKYPNVKAYMDQSIEDAQRNGYAQTLTGRRRQLRDINSNNRTVKGFAERNAINSPVQGAAADLIKIAMIRIHKEMEQRQMKSRMLLQVHDELVFEADHDEVDSLSALVKELMEGAMDLEVPMVVEIGLGSNWLEAH